ncbi:hypothetical protein [Geopsychrobacter electrodiphilus]|uniref:hypothetical protein n=1 Tax=Geopsychrobacter electrodiphilus TaxID=225196 RepID=UPI00036C52B8|nr:hypothetical protein [Geopsychrobacter electrodiphilus]
MRDKRDSEHGNSPRMGRIGNRPYWLLNLSLPIRAAHQVGAAVFLAAYLLNVLPGPPRLYVGIALISGGLLMLSEWLRHRQIFREVAGLITLTKILLLGAAYHGYLPTTETVLLAFVIASIGAHAPKNVRHRLLF